MQTKEKSIILFKDKNKQSSNKKINGQKSKSRLRDQVHNINSGFQSSRIKPIDYVISDKPYSNVCNMQDPQIRIKRQYSPLYQRSHQENQLFDKGIKKSTKNINLISKVIITDNPNHPQALPSSQLTSTRSVRRLNPNKQHFNILDLESFPKQSPLSSRSINKINHNKQSQNQSTQSKKSQIKYKNHETSETADHVVRELSNHVANITRDVHLKFYKKENLLNKENLCNQVGLNSQTDINKQYKRHYSHLITVGNKENIEIRENGISIKKMNEQQNIDFSHDFYKKESRIPNQKQTNSQFNQPLKLLSKHFAPNNNLPPRFNPTITKPIPYTKTQSKQNNQSNRMGQLRKKFF